MKFRLGISACLIGDPVRYDGQHRRSALLVDTMGDFIDWIPVCPEVESGMGIPREKIRLTQIDGNDRLMGEESASDMTDAMHAWSTEQIDDLLRHDIDGYVFKTRSPSCAITDAPIYDAHGLELRRGAGFFARVLQARVPMLPLIDDETLRQPEARDDFIEQLFTYRRIARRESRGAR